MKNLKLQWALLSTFFIIVEVMFRIQSGNFAVNILLLRSLTFALFVAGLFFVLNALSKSKAITVITIIYGFWVTLYSFIQIGMKAYYESFFSFRFITQQVPDVGSYAQDFLAFLKPTQFIVWVAFVAFTYLYLKLRKQQTVFLQIKKAYPLILVTLSLFGVYFGLVQVDTQQYIESSFNLLKNPFYTESAMNQLGVLSFMNTDFQYVLFPKRAVQKIEWTPEEPPIETPKEPEVDPLVREMDDTEWLKVLEGESDDNFKRIDSYFLNQSITPKNDKTGLYEDKNLIYFLVEAFDELAIHPEITPTLYKMKMEGMYFNQFHSPQFNCATAESELMSVSSLFPVVGTCTMSSYYQNTNPQTIYQLFKKKGYDTSSFHNWNDQFYPRTEIHPFLGSDVYKDEADTIPKWISGWQSDLTMMKTVVEDLNAKEGKFMSYVITSSTHFPYDEGSNLGDKHLAKVKASLPNAPIDIQRYLSKSVELDLAVQYLIENLERMNDTVLVFFSDHRPFKMSGQLVSDYADNTNKGNSYDSTPMMIYTPQGNGEVISKVSSTIDLVPTIANLFDLEYDPRLFMGSDIFSMENNTMIMQSGSWRDQVGVYDATKAVFTPYNPDVTYSDEEVKRHTTAVKQKLAIASSVYLKGYFNERPFLRLND